MCPQPQILCHKCINFISPSGNNAYGDFFLMNHDPQVCFSCITQPTSPGEHWCYKNDKFMETPRDHEHCYIAGFVCKPYSLENNKRNLHTSLESLFDPDGIEADNVMTFFACSRHIRIRRVDSFILENTKGCLAKLKDLDKVWEICQHAPLNLDEFVVVVVVVVVHLHRTSIYIHILFVKKCRKIYIRSDVILSALDLHDDKAELTSLGGAVVSLPAQHPLILSPTPPAMWGKGSGVFSSHKGSRVFIIYTSIHPSLLIIGMHGELYESVYHGEPCIPMV